MRITSSRVRRRCTIGRGFAALCALAITAAGAGALHAAAPPGGVHLQPFSHGKNADTPPITATHTPLLILYDQTTALGNGSTSQNFEAIYDAYDNQGADDFTATGPGWNITRVTVPGVYSAGGGPTPSAGVQFYTDASGLPGTLICNYPSVVPTTDLGGTLFLDLPSACNIGPGVHAWVSVFANLDATTAGQWFWATRTVLAGSPAVWQNPGDGFGTGCLTWATRTSCLGGTAPDMGFRLEGDLAACTNDAQCIDSNLCNGVESCVNSVCTPGTPVNCDDGLVCTIDSCDQSTGTCIHAVNTCDDADICTTDGPCVEGSGCQYVNNCVHVCSSEPISIPDGGPATPYPSPITVSGVTYPAIVGSVELNGLTHTFPDDLDIMLVGPVNDDQNAILMSDAGGGTDVSGINLKFTDTAANPIPDSAPLVSGTYQPANYDSSGTDPDPFPAPAPTWSGSTAISTFNGNPNGTFKLFVNDEFTPDGGSLASWCLNILPVGCSDSSECDDGNFCTSDECVNGGCQNTADPTVCDDLNPCTIDNCSQADGCGYLPNPCDDNNACTADSCTDFVGCNNVVTVICDDGNPTTTDTCDPATGNCVYTGSCDDGIPCTIDSFDSGTMQCVHTPNNAACDDGNVCTDDVCTATGCAHSNNTAPCDDGESCTSGDTCQSGVCVGTTSQPNPKTKGFYKKACQHNEITAEQAACVAMTAPMTFGDTDTPQEVCDEIDGHDSELPTHDSDEKHCTKDETELLVLALNVCTGRVCRAQPIESHCGDNTTVQESIDEADQIFGDPNRTSETCSLGKCLAKEINNGKAFRMDTLQVTKASNRSTLLTWTPPFIGDQQSVIRYEIWRSVRGADAFVLINSRTQTNYVDNTDGEFDYEVLVEIQD